MTKFLYFMEETDGAFDAAYDGYCPNVSRFRGFNSTGTTTTMQLQFDSSLGEGADIAACDSVLLTITANKQKEVMQDIVAAINAHPNQDPFIVISDDSNSVFASQYISGCAITLTSPA